MSWHYSQAVVAEYSEENCSDGEPSVQSKSTTTADESLCSDKTMESSNHSQSGTTCEPSTGDRGEDVLTSFLGAFPVRTSVVLEKEPESTESEADSGEKWHASFAKYNHDTHSWRTHQCSLLGGFIEFSETWPKWGLMRDGECWVQTMSVHHIEGNASGLLLPTPRSADGPHGGNGPNSRDLSLSAMARHAMWPTPHGFSKDGKSNGPSGNELGRAVNQSLFGVPTPSASMAKGSSQNSLTRKSGKSRENDRLDHHVMASHGGSLNPAWVEWLMGWPINWTAMQSISKDSVNEWLYANGNMEVQESMPKGVCNGFMRHLWWGTEPPKTPPRWRHFEQHGSERGNSLSRLPHSEPHGTGELGEGPSSGEGVSDLRYKIQAEKVKGEAVRESRMPSSEWKAVSRTTVEKTNRVSRLKAIGNGQVPAVAALAWEMLTT